MPELLAVQESQAQELFFDRGWSDGLPIVPPTPGRVEAMLAAGEVAGTDLLGTVSQRGRSVTAHDAAVAAVMAGCRPEYFPVVLAAFGAMLDPAFNVHTAATSTGGAAFCLVVSGPLAPRIGMAGQHNALGSGNRANATIGRSVRLAAMNVLGARTGGMDGSSLGHPGKYTFCFAEDPPPEPWQPLHIDLGFDADDTTVTLMATEAPRQVANHLNADPADILRTMGAAIRNPSMFCAGKGGQVIAVLGPEHAQALVQGGWSRAQVCQFLADEVRISPEELSAAGVLLEAGAQHVMVPGEDGKLATVADPSDVVIVTAGGAGAGWSAAIPAWAPVLHSRSVTRRVRRADESLPDCGPDSCEVPLPRG